MVFRRTQFGISLATLLVAGFIGQQAAMAQQDAPAGGRGGQAESDRGAQRGEGRRPGGDQADRKRDGRGDRAERGDRGDRGRGPGGRGGRGGGWGNPSEGVLSGPMSRVTASLFRPDYMTRDSLMIITELDLDDRQGEVVEMLLDDYDANFRMAVEETQMALREMAASSGVAESQEDQMAQMRERMESMRSEMRKMREAARGDQNGEDGAKIAPEQVEEAREAFRSRMRDMRDEFRGIREEQMASDDMQSLLTSQIALLKQFANARRGMRNEMDGALGSILADEQLSQWDAVARTIRRIRLLPEGRLQGESTDLRPLTQDVSADLAVEQTVLVNDVLSAWELDLDDALVKRRLFDETAIWKVFDSMQNRDFEALMNVMKNRQRIAERIRDTNDLAIEAVAESMGGEAGPTFRREALQRGYERVFQPSRAQRAIAAALELEGLEAELITDITALQVRADEIMGDENERVLDVVRQHEELREMRYIQRELDRQNGEETERNNQDDPIRVAYNTRNEVDEELIEELRDLLGEERASGLRGMNRGQRDWGNRDMSRPEDREAMRQQFMERFDANGDGEISESEREAIRAHFLEQREGRGGPGGPGGRGGRGGPVGEGASRRPSGPPPSE